MTQVLLCGAMVVTLSMGIRHGFGLWLQPITMDRGWTRETFAFALAVQNLMWGVASPFAGGLADRFGAHRVLFAGALLYAGGLALMSAATSGLEFLGGAGLMIGVAQAGTTYAVVYGVIARQVDPARRTWAMSITAAAGSFGQFLMVPVDSWLIGSAGWQNALFILALLACLILPLGLGLKEPPVTAAAAAARQSVAAALREAFGHRSFQLLTAGYFVCGFQLAFITVHMPSYLKDRALAPEVATVALMLIGLFNIFGTYGVGVLAQRWAKHHLLSAIYLLRGLIIVAFVLAPLSASSVYLFAGAMGLLWLSTVPPTNAIVAQIFGPQYMSMLGGFVFLSHQLGSFIGVWLGGRLFDTTGSYAVVWWLAAALGLFAAIVNLPVRETAVVRPGLKTA
jgi:predicted MFS family arabinose efflux permease